MLKFKACTRCGGDMHKVEDIYGAFDQCFQCGHVVDLPSKTLLSYSQPTARKAKVKAGGQEAA